MQTTNTRIQFPILPFILFVFGLLGFALWLVNTSFAESTSQITVMKWAELTPLQIEIVNKSGNHAYVKHGIEATLALKCLQEHGSKQSFDTFPNEDPTFNSVTFLCNFPKQPDTNYAVVLKKMMNGTWELITAYKVSKEIFPSLANYVGYLFEYWNASSSKIVIKAGEIVYNFTLK